MPETPRRTLAAKRVKRQDGRMSSSHSADGALILLAGAAPDAAAPLLQEAGCLVRRALSATALLRLAQEAPAPRLILLGETVGDAPGLGLLSRLLDDPVTRAIPVLFVTQAGDEELALALGAADCLSLPLRPLVLLARVQAQLRLAALAGLSGVVS